MLGPIVHDEAVGPGRSGLVGACGPDGAGFPGGAFGAAFVGAPALLRQERARGVEQAQLAQRLHEAALRPCPVGGELDVFGIHPAQNAVGTVGRGPQPQPDERQNGIRAEAQAELAHLGMVEEVELEADIDVHGFPCVWLEPALPALPYFYKSKRQKQGNFNKSLF